MHIFSPVIGIKGLVSESDIVDLAVPVSHPVEHAAQQTRVAEVAFEGYVATL
jgi:hypothetical protein